MKGILGNYNVVKSGKMKFAQSVETFLSNSEDKVLIDIRPQVDYQRSHISNAISLPFPIKLKALRKKYTPSTGEDSLNRFIDNTEQWRSEVSKYLNQGLVLYIYCQVGGLRSFYFHKVFENHTSSLVFLEGGYEAYCLFQIEYFKTLSMPFLHVLKGKTGCGKTEILDELAKQGQQVITLSTLAKHRGSAFGRFPQTIQPTSTQFRNELLQRCLELDFSKPVFVEQEGAFIGSVSVPEFFFAKLQQGKTIQLKVPKSSRVTYLLQQYAGTSISNTLHALYKIKNRLTLSDFRKAKDHLIHNRKQKFVSLMVDYYDQGNIYRHNSRGVFSLLNFPIVDPPNMAAIIIQNS